MFLDPTFNIPAELAGAKTNSHPTPGIDPNPKPDASATSDCPVNWHKVQPFPKIPVADKIFWCMPNTLGAALAPNNYAKPASTSGPCEPGWEQTGGLINVCLPTAAKWNEIGRNFLIVGIGLGVIIVGAAALLRDAS